MPDAKPIIKVLVTPLDWGLGHATRCIPLIHEFIKQGCEVQIASSGDAFILLKEEFPFLKFHSLASYRATYSASLPFLIKMALQIPKFMSVIRQEHLQIKEIIEAEEIDIVISDNRYGCWSAKAKSIFVCHQLKLRVPFFSNALNFFHQRAIKRFAECWVPDDEGESLAGELCVNNKLKPHYIGLLSRMQWSQLPTQYEILTIISGPEPQRTIFEGVLIAELKTSNKKSLIIRGLPGESGRTVSGNLEMVNHLNSSNMNKAILESDLIIARSGYSTIMDIATLGKRAIFVPTPGQVEQEYLAKELMKKKMAFAVPQDSFNLQHALAQVKEYTGFTRRKENTSLSDTIKKLLNETN